MRTMILIRGLPGSGKSTLAKLISSQTSFVHLETDMFFVVDGEYGFRREYLKAAHNWCLEKTQDVCQSGFDVIVSNTFTTRKEMQPYADIATANNMRLHIIKCENRYKSVHNVPDEVIQRMRERWDEV